MPKDKKIREKLPSPAEWKDSSLYKDLVNGKLDPKEWDYDQFAITTDMFSNLLFALTEVDMPLWNFSATYSLPEEVFILTVCRFIFLMIF